MEQNRSEDMGEALLGMNSVIWKKLSYAVAQAEITKAQKLENNLFFPEI